MTDPLLTHAREFTQIEDDTLTLWNSLQDAGEEAAALALLDAGLMLEHYTSLLPHLVAERSADQLATQARLRQVLDVQLQRGRDLLAAAE